MNDEFLFAPASPGRASCRASWKPGAMAVETGFLIALAVVGVVMKLVRNDLAAALAGAGTVALSRWLLAA